MRYATGHDVDSVPLTCATSPALAAATSEAPPHAAKAATHWTALPSGVVDGGEIVLLAIKPSMWRPLLDSAPWLIVCSTFATMCLVKRGSS